MAAYEYLCMACEQHFEERRPMTAAVDTVDTALACPSCGSDRVRRRFSFVAGRASAGTSAAESSGGCGCGSCTCGA